MAFNRALERRLGKAPSPTAVSKAAEALSGTKGLDFVRHAVRVQEQLASLHAQLQKEQERHGRATEAFQDSSVSSMVPQKRSVGHDDKPSDSPRETKRLRTESADPRRHTPPSTSDNGVKPDLQTPIASMSPRDVPIAPRSMTSDPKFADVPLTEPAKTRESNSPSRPPISDAIPPNNTKSESSRQTEPHSPLDATLGDGDPGQTISHHPSIWTVTHDQNKLDKAPSPPIPTSIPETKGSPLTT